MRSVGLHLRCPCFLPHAKTPYADNEAGETLGYILEEQAGFFSMLRRQAFATHRPFRAVIMDAHGTPLLWVRSGYLSHTVKVALKQSPARSAGRLLGSTRECMCNDSRTMTHILPKASLS